MLSLRLEVLLHEHVLTAAVPECEHQVAQKAHSVLVDIHCEGDTVSISGEVVRENDTSHGCLAGALSAHEEHFFDSFALGLRCLLLRLVRDHFLFI